MLPMHFLSPHVLSTQKEPETTMGSTRPLNITSSLISRRIVDDNGRRHSCRRRRFRSCRRQSEPATTTTTSVDPQQQQQQQIPIATTTTPDDADSTTQCRSRAFATNGCVDDNDDKFIYELLWRNIVNKWQHAVPGRYVPAILCTHKEAERFPIDNVVSSGRIGGSGHNATTTAATTDALCAGAQRCHRWRRATPDRLSSVALVGCPILGRTETDTVVSERIGSRVRVLQSHPLEPSQSARYAKASLICTFV